MDNKRISEFIEKHFRHFNAASLLDASKAYAEQIDRGAKMMITLAGAVSTAELGKSLAEMIRKEKVHIISCTGANMEEDVFNLVAHSHYKRIPGYRSLNEKDETELLAKGYNRVTDTCIPEEEAMRRIEKHLMGVWEKANNEGNRLYPHEYFYEILRSGELEEYYEIDPSDSWLLAAAEKNLPLLVPGWEDSTCANFFASHCIQELYSPSIIRSGIEYMIFLADWYQKNSANGIGFFQIGGGIAGDFPICVVPMLHQDLQLEDIPVWSYFCQISESITSFGSYSGAVPNEKITWGKLGPDTPRFIIESDATIVAPLLFAYVLGW